MFSSYIKKYLRQLLANKFTLIGLAFLLITTITKPAQQAMLPSTMPDVTAETAENFMGQYLFAHIHDAQKEMACLRFYTPYIRKPHNLTPGQILYLAEHRPWELSEKKTELQRRYNTVSVPVSMPATLEQQQEPTAQKEQTQVKKSARIAAKATLIESANKRACQESTPEQDILEVTSGSESGLEDDSQDNDTNSDDQAAYNQADKEAAKNIPTLACPLCKTRKKAITLNGLSRHLRKKHNTTLQYFATTHSHIYKTFFTWTTLTALQQGVDYEKSEHYKNPEYSCLTCNYKSKNALTFVLHVNSMHRTPEEVESAVTTVE